MLRYLTAGESHGSKLTVIIDGLPADLKIDTTALLSDMKKRRAGYGRSPRMKLENDKVVFSAGVRNLLTTGAPVAIEIENKVFENHKELWTNPNLENITVPRPGHADFAGWAKYEGTDIRNVIERASARETAARVAAGSLAKMLLAEFSVGFRSKVLSIGPDSKGSGKKDWNKAIDEAGKSGDSVGGRFECKVTGLLPGLGSYDQWDRRLDGRISGAVMAVQGVKAVAIGDGFDADKYRGSQFRDGFRLKNGRIKRIGNHAGGLEGGVTNGQDLIIKAVMKPIPGVRVKTPSIDLKKGGGAPSWHERADTCVVEAAAAICEGMIAWELAKAVKERYGGDTIKAMTYAWKRDKRGLEKGWKGR